VGHLLGKGGLLDATSYPKVLRNALAHLLRKFLQDRTRAARTPRLDDLAPLDAVHVDVRKLPLLSSGLHAQ
jgi:hypothetical protein